MRQPLSVALALGLAITGTALAAPTTVGQPTKHQPGNTALQKAGQGTAYTVAPYGTPGNVERVAGSKETVTDYKVYYTPANYEVRTDQGVVTYHTLPMWEADSSLTATDRTVLHDLYARQMLESSVLAAHLDHFRNNNDPWTAGMFGNLLTDQLILASRARQLYRQTGTVMPEVVTDVRLAEITPNAYTTSNLTVQRAELDRLNAAYANIQDPRLQQLVTDARQTRERHVAMIQTESDRLAALALEPTEQVAGVRLVRGDNFILSHFYKKQVGEAAMLRSQAMHLRTIGANTWADHFEHMARDHDKLATDAEAMMKSRNLTIPQMGPTPTITGSTDTLIRHMRDHHQSALQEWDHYSQDASDPAVRELLQRAMKGTEEHLKMLEGGTTEE